MFFAYKHKVYYICSRYKTLKYFKTQNVHKAFSWVVVGETDIQLVELPVKNKP